jgi:hypothetical protein
MNVCKEEKRPPVSREFLPRGDAKPVRPPVFPNPVFFPQQTLHPLSSLLYNATHEHWYRFKIQHGDQACHFELGTMTTLAYMAGDTLNGTG